MSTLPKTLICLLTVALCIFQSKESAAKTLTIGVEAQNYMPFFETVDGEFLGFARDLFDAYANAHNHEIKYVALPVKRLISDYGSERVDFKYPDSPKWGLEEKTGLDISYSIPTLKVIYGMSIRPQFEGRPLSDIEIFSTVLGFTPRPYMSLIESGDLTVSKTTNLNSLVSQALAGRVDGIYASKSVISYILEQRQQQGQLIFAENYPGEIGLYSLSSFKYPDIIKEFDHWMATHQDDILALKQKYKIADQ